MMGDDDDDDDYDDVKCETDSACATKLENTHIYHTWIYI